MNTISQHPNPQFERADFFLLNGEWEFSYTPFPKDADFSFLSEESVTAHCNTSCLTNRITVPFCPQSVLSGIGYTGFIAVAEYRKTVDICKNGRRVFLHIGAADYMTTVLINGKSVGQHKGGYTSFAFDITDAVRDGENEIYIHCQDNERDPFIPRGKQCEHKESQGCDYTRTTGIWQNVWLEYTPQAYIKNFRVYPDTEHATLTINGEFIGSGIFTAEAYYNGKPVGSATGRTDSLTIRLSEKHLWEPGCGRLYDLVLRYGEDTVYSYFGLRSVALDGMRFLINGKSVFQRLVLDQGFYRKGIYTPQDDDERKKDILLSLSVGFNGARLHQKVFDPRYLYYCDKMGYLVWGEYANWGLDHSDERATEIFLNEWTEALERDFNHPAIIGWCPFNETWDVNGRPQCDSVLRDVYRFTKAFDTTRPCIDTSGNFHVETDIYDLHDYRGETDEFKESFDRFMTENYLYEHVLNFHKNRQKYSGEPVFISEYGGIKWETDKAFKSWGYGKDVRTPEEFLARYQGLTEALLGNSKFFGFCYTQLYDIEQEQNGLFTYDRTPKFSDEIYAKIKAVNTQKAAIE